MGLHLTCPRHTPLESTKERCQSSDTKDSGMLTKEAEKKPMSTNLRLYREYKVGKAEGFEGKKLDKMNKMSKCVCVCIYGHPPESIYLI